MKYVDREERAGRFLFGAAGGVANHRAHLLDLRFSFVFAVTIRRTGSKRAIFATISA